MFETSKDNYQSVKLFSQTNHHIFSNSIANMVYQSMPNGTDFSNVKDLYQGLNYANLGGGYNYHTQNDHPSYLGTSYLTQQANMLYHTLHEMKDMDLSVFNQSSGEAIFFTYLGGTVIYSETVALILGIVTLLLLIVLIFVSIWKKAFDFKKGLKSFALLFVLLLLSAVLGYLLYYVLNHIAALLGVIDVSTVGTISYSSSFLIVMMMLIVLLSLIFVGNRLFKRFNLSGQDLQKVYTYFVSFLTVVLSFVLKEASFLFLWMALPLLVIQLL